MTDVQSETFKDQESGQRKGHDRVSFRTKIYRDHEKIKNLAQTAAVVIAGLWIGAVWLYDNWAAQYLEAHFAKLNVDIVRS